MKSRSHLIPHRIDGFTLVEVMVALVVLSIGLLGIIKLSLGSVQANGSALMRSQATQLIQQMMDDMRANQTAAVAGNYTLGMGVNPGVGQNCNTGTCTSAQVAGYDLAKWYQMVSTLLPGGKGQVGVVLTPNLYTGGNENNATVTVTWVDTVAQTTFANGSAVPGTPMTVVMESLL